MIASATVNDVITIDYNHQSQQPDSKALNVEIFCFSVNHGSTRKLFLKEDEYHKTIICVRRSLIELDLQLLCPSQRGDWSWSFIVYLHWYNCGFQVFYMIMRFFI